MTTQPNLPPVHPDWPQRYDDIMARQADAAVKISGAGQSSYNGKVVENTTGQGSYADWDGTIGYDQGYVANAMKSVAAYSGHHHDPATLLTYRQAVQSMLHENSHMLGPKGDVYAQSAPEYGTAHGRALEEGITEAWSRAHVDEYIAEMGFEKDAPGISGVVQRDAYPQFTPAATTLCDELSKDTGLGGDEVMRRLNNESVRGKWPAAADMVFQSSGLQNQLPAAEQDAAKQRIQTAMQNRFAQLPTLQGTPQQVELASMATGVASVQAGRTEGATIRQEQAQATAKAAQSQTQGQGQTQSQSQGQTQSQGQAPPQPAVGSPQHTMAMAQGGVAPLGGAQALNADQFGSRREGSHSGQGAERTTPQRGE